MQQTTMANRALTIRPIAEAEAAAVVALWHACGLTRPWNDPQQDIALARDKAGSDVLVGLLDGRIVASVMVGHDGHRGAMYYVSVDPAHRGLGFGRQIIAEAEDWMRDRGVWKANLLVRTGNEAVLAFYEELGYARGSSVPIEKWLDPSRRGDA